MKITVHEGRTKIPEVTMVADPMTVWLDARIEMTIRRGDKLRKVASRIAKLLDLPKKDARGLAAYYFALGERIGRRRLGDPWKSSERRVDPNRRYSPRKV